MTTTPLDIETQNGKLRGDLTVPSGAGGLVVFAHGSGSSRHSPRNRFVADRLQIAGLATFLVDLLTPQEEAVDLQTTEFRFDIELLAVRLVEVVRFMADQQLTMQLTIGLFGASTGAGAALVAASREPALVKAVVSRGGRPDLAGEALSSVSAPTLLLVGGNDSVVIELNKKARAMLQAAKCDLEIIPGAGHLFEEPGALEQVASYASEWFLAHLPS